MLSALGLAVSDLRRDYVAPLFGDAGELAADELEAAFAALERRAEADLPAPVDAPALRRRAVPGPVVRADDPGGRALDGHRSRSARRTSVRYGYELPDTPVELVAIRVAGTSAVPKPKLAGSAHGRRHTRRRSSGSAYFDGEWRETRIVAIESLAPGDSFAGPAVVEFPEATCVVRPGWTATLDAAGALVLERS